MTRARGLRQLAELGKFEVTLSDRVIPYTLRRSRTARLVWLNIKRETGLTVTIPPHYSPRSVPEFLRSNSRWILKNVIRYCRQSPVQAAAAASAPSVPYLGRELRVMQRTSPESGLPISLEPNTLIISLAPECGLVRAGEVHKWLRRQATVVINEKARAFSSELGFVYNRVAVKEQRSRWGSCSQRRNLNFNWRLIMAPEPVLDYVIIHELCHLQEMSHSKKFWALVAGHCPDWHNHRSWLDEHCAELNARFKFD